jgi:hypothetical protein
MVYLYDACGQISHFCHQQLLRKMRRKISWTDEGRKDGRTDGQTDRGKTSIPPSPFGERGYNEKKPELIGVGMNVPYHDQNNVIAYLPPPPPPFI